MIPTKRVCSCGQVFKSNGEVKCPGCLKWNNYKVEHPQTEKKEIVVLPKLRFNFKSTWSNSWIETYDKTSILGYHSRDKNDPNKHVIHINLYKFANINENQMIKNLCETLNHEMMHYVLMLESIDACVKYDNISKKLENFLNE